MKALIIKDFYSLGTQLKLFAVIIVAFSLMNSDFQNSFAVIFAALLPYTALAYDERSKWDRMANVMPYSKKDIVLSKYVLGIIFVIFAVIINIIIRVVKADIQPIMLATAFCGALLAMAVSFPLMFRFGVEKSRLILFLVIFLICFGASFVPELTLEMSTLGSISDTMGLVILFVVAIVAIVFSVSLSKKMYDKRSL